MTEYAFWLVLMVINLFVGGRSTEMKGYAITVKLMDFGLLSAVEVFSSPKLRSFLMREVLKINRSVKVKKPKGNARMPE